MVPRWFPHSKCGSQTTEFLKIDKRNIISIVLQANILYVEVIFIFRAYDPAEYEHLPASTEIKELFQYITR